MSTPSPLPAQLIAALQRGDAMAAVKLLRDAASVSLAENSQPDGGQRRPAAGGAVALRAPVFSSGLPPRVVDALQRGDKIEAVRLMREITGVGLKEAKDAVDASPHSAARSGLSPGEVPRTGRRIWAALILGLVVLALYLGLRSAGD